ncbi:hypothetical protein KY363_05385 [Candidatus Woesearchaeota archaeon]|nr:hypothetical protein [Candidatus Woesearchaeota archaeon]
MTEKPKLSDIVRRFNTERLDGAFEEPKLDESSRLETGVDLPGGLTSVLSDLKKEIQDPDYQAQRAVNRAYCDRLLQERFDELKRSSRETPTLQDVSLLRKGIAIDLIVERLSKEVLRSGLDAYRQSPGTWAESAGADLSSQVRYLLGDAGIDPMIIEHGWPEFFVQASQQALGIEVDDSAAVREYLDSALQKVGKRFGSEFVEAYRKEVGKSSLYAGAMEELGRRILLRRSGASGEDHGDWLERNISSTPAFASPFGIEVLLEAVRGDETLEKKVIRQRERLRDSMQSRAFESRYGSLPISLRLFRRGRINAAVGHLLDVLGPDYVLALWYSGLEGSEHGSQGSETVRKIVDTLAEGGLRDPVFDLDVNWQRYLGLAAAESAREFPARLEAWGEPVLLYDRVEKNVSEGEFRSEESEDEMRVGACETRRTVVSEKRVEIANEKGVVHSDGLYHLGIPLSIFMSRSGSKPPEDLFDAEKFSEVYLDGVMQEAKEVEVFGEVFRRMFSDLGVDYKTWRNRLEKSVIGAVYGGPFTNYKTREQLKGSEEIREQAAAGLVAQSLDKSLFYLFKSNDWCFDGIEHKLSDAGVPSHVKYCLGMAGLPGSTLDLDDIFWQSCFMVAATDVIDADRRAGAEYLLKYMDRKKLARNFKLYRADRDKWMRERSREVSQEVKDILRKVKASGMHDLDMRDVEEDWLVYFGLAERFDHAHRAKMPERFWGNAFQYLSGIVLGTSALTCSATVYGQVADRGSDESLLWGTGATVFFLALGYLFRKAGKSVSSSGAEDEERMKKVYTERDAFQKGRRAGEELMNKIYAESDSGK